MLVGGEILIGGMDFNGEKGRGRCTGFALGVICIFLGEGSCGGSCLGGVRENPCAINFKNTKQRAARLTLTEERETILLFLGEGSCGGSRT